LILLVKKGIKAIKEEVYEYISLAVQERLRTILEQLIEISKHRIEINKDELPYTVVFDIKKKAVAYNRKKEKKRRKR